MAGVARVSSSHQVPANSAAILFGPDAATPELLLPSHKMEDMVPEHVQMATAIYAYAGEHIDIIMRWFRSEMERREGSKQ